MESFSIFQIVDKHIWTNPAKTVDLYKSPDGEKISTVSGASYVGKVYTWTLKGSVLWLQLHSSEWLKWSVGTFDEQKVRMQGAKTLLEEAIEENNPVDQKSNAIDFQQIISILMILAGISLFVQLIKIFKK